MNLTAPAPIVVAAKKLKSPVICPDRLVAIYNLIQEVIDNNVPGDLVDYGPHESASEFISTAKKIAGWNKELYVLNPITSDMVFPDVVAFFHIAQNNRLVVISALEEAYERMPAGGIIVIDGYGSGWTKHVSPGVDEFLKGKPEQLEVTVGGIQACFRKMSSPVIPVAVPKTTDAVEILTGRYVTTPEREESVEEEREVEEEEIGEMVDDETVADFNDEVESVEEEESKEAVIEVKDMEEVVNSFVDPGDFIPEADSQNEEDENDS